MYMFTHLFLSLKLHFCTLKAWHSSQSFWNVRANKYQMNKPAVPTLDTAAQRTGLSKIAYLHFLCQSTVSRGDLTNVFSLKNILRLFGSQLYKTLIRVMFQEFYLIIFSSLAKSSSFGCQCSNTLTPSV